MRDLTRESLLKLKENFEKDMDLLSQDFFNSIRWNPVPANETHQNYFNINCRKLNDVDYDDNLNYFDSNIQKNNMYCFKGAMTEEELKTCTTFPLFCKEYSYQRFLSFASQSCRNQNKSPFKRAHIGRHVDMKALLLMTPIKFKIVYGEVSGGLNSFGTPSACYKKQYLDKLKLMVLMRDSLNSLFKDCKYVTDVERRKIIVYGWIQVGLVISFYAMNWIGNGVYRIGKVDECQLPVDETHCSMFEDIYCILKCLEVKFMETERNITNLLTSNVQGKCRRLMEENPPKLNVNSTP
nr:14593_t:CDS:2 [Entrophospora candida]